MITNAVSDGVVSCYKLPSSIAFPSATLERKQERRNAGRASTGTQAVEVHDPVRLLPGRLHHELAGGRRISRLGEVEPRKARRAGFGPLENT